MSTQHTPGPWEQNGLSIKVKRGVVAVCPTPQTNGLFDCSANARLIAAAPDMLKTLQAIANTEKHERDGTDCTIETIHKFARAAIAKATQP